MDRTIVAELAEHTSDDELDVEGLGGVLQKEPEAVETGDSDNKRENINDHLGNIDVLERPTKTPSKGFFYGKEMKAAVNLQPQVEHLERQAKPDLEF